MHKGHPAKRKPVRVQKGERAPAPHTIPNNIKSWRGRRQLSQEELAEIMNVSRVTISNWENGVKSPNDRNKVALCKALGCSMYELFNWEV